MTKIVNYLFVKVSVFGGYSDPRGDASKNSMSLLSAFQDVETTLEVGFKLLGRHYLAEDCN